MPDELRGQTEHEIMQLNLPTFSAFRPAFITNRPESSYLEKLA